jgi:class 3 adenylate cyclase
MISPLPKDIVEATIAIVLTDIIGSTKFVQKVGKTLAAIKFAQHDRMVMAAIKKCNGQLVDASDGHLMYFPSVANAIAFAFQYKADLKYYKFPFNSRVGIHWDSMLIVKSAEHIVRAGGKRINLEGLGKNIAARTMSLCGKNQILLSKAAYLTFKKRIVTHKNIPANSLVGLVGLYKFKGIKDPELIYAIGTQQAHLQPPQSNEKAKRLGGNKKIKTKLKHKKIKELLVYLYYRLGLLFIFYNFYIFWPLLSSPKHKSLWGLNYPFLKIFEHLDTFFTFLLYIINQIITYNF